MIKRGKAKGTGEEEEDEGEELKVRGEGFVSDENAGYLCSCHKSYLK